VAVSLIILSPDRSPAVTVDHGAVQWEHLWKSDVLPVDKGLEGCMM